MFGHTLTAWKDENAAKRDHERLCSPSDWVDTIAALIQADLVGRLDNLRKHNTLVELAHVVDPRFCLKGIPEMDHTCLKAKLAIYLDVITPVSSTRPSTTVESNQSSSTNQGSMLPSLSKKQKVMKRAFYEQDVRAITYEIDSWFRQDPEAEDIDPLAWFKVRVDSYPRIAAAAKNLLGVPATSMPSEQLFSVTGNIITKKRCNLNSKVVQATLCLRDWGYGISETQDLDDEDLTEEIGTEWQTIMHNAFG